MFKKGLSSTLKWHDMQKGKKYDSYIPEPLKLVWNEEGVLSKTSNSCVCFENQLKVILTLIVLCRANYVFQLFFEALLLKDEVCSMLLFPYYFGLMGPLQNKQLKRFIIFDFWGCHEIVIIKWSKG